MSSSCNVFLLYSCRNKKKNFTFTNALTIKSVLEEKKNVFYKDVLLLAPFKSMKVKTMPLALMDNMCSGLKKDRKPSD